MNQTLRPPIPIYTTRGDVEAFLSYPYVFNRIGEWIGWVTPEREVYSVLGHYVGRLTDEPRILRPRTPENLPAPRTPPSPPPRLLAPPTVPLAPLLRELRFDTVDVLQDEPELLHTPDSGEPRQDLD